MSKTVERQIKEMEEEVLSELPLKEYLGEPVEVQIFKVNPSLHSADHDIFKGVLHTNGRILTSEGGYNCESHANGLHYLKNDLIAHAVILKGETECRIW